jgi:hypothetical protein
MELEEAVEIIQQRAQEAFNELRGFVADDRFDKLVQSRVRWVGRVLPPSRFFRDEIRDALWRANLSRTSVRHLGYQVKIVLYKRGESPSIALVGFPKVHCLSSDPDHTYITCVFSDGAESAVARREIHDDSEVYETGTAGLLLVSEREGERLIKRSHARAELPTG